VNDFLDVRKFFSGLKIAPAIVGVAIGETTESFTLNDRHAFLRGFRRTVPFGCGRTLIHKTQACFGRFTLRELQSIIEVAARKAEPARCLIPPSKPSRLPGIHHEYDASPGILSVAAKKKLLPETGQQLHHW
jgi:hypothetical protein